MTIIDTLMRTARERRRRGGPGCGDFRIAVLHPADYHALEMEIAAAWDKGESWAMATYRPATASWRSLALPEGLVARCSPGVVQGWAVLEDDWGAESLTMIRLGVEPSTRNENETNQGDRT